MLKQKKELGVFTLTLINVSAIFSLHSLPVMAAMGWSSIFYYLLVCILFFIPVSLVSTELATGWPKAGGIYHWIREAFGPKWGFFSIWLLWVHNVVWFPTILSFSAVSLAYVFHPDLANNKFFLFSLTIFFLWLCTFLNFYGMKISGFISSFGVLAGTLIPGAVTILFGIFWLLTNQHNEIPFCFKSCLPDITSYANISFLTTLLLSLGGMEMSAVHAREVDNPQKSYPQAIFYSLILISFFSILGSLAIAFVVTAPKIDMVAGNIQALIFYFDHYNLPFLFKIFSFMISLGAVAMLNTWLIGPVKGLLQTANEGLLPPIFHKKNQNDSPTFILISQAIFVSFLCCIFLFMPTTESFYWVLTILTTLLYITMYFFLFAAAIQLRYSQPYVKRLYRVPGKNWGMWLASGIGIFSCLFSFIFGFIPPEQILRNIEETKKFSFLIEFYSILGGGYLLLVTIPFIIYACRKESWKVKEEMEDYTSKNA